MSVITTAHFKPTRPTVTLLLYAISLPCSHATPLTTRGQRRDVCQRCCCSVGGTDSLLLPTAPRGKTTTTENAQTEEKFRGIISSSRKEATNLVYTQPTMNGDTFCSDRSFAVTVPEASVTIDFVLYRDQSNLSQ